MGKPSGTQRGLRLLISLYFPIIAVVLALALGALFITALGFNWKLAYQNMITGALGTVNAVGETLVKAIPLIFTGLSFAIGRRCGLVNLGAEGQVYMGGLFAAYIGINLKGLPIFIHLPLTLIAGAVGGGLLGLLISYLKNRFNASEMITGIMFNYMAVQLVSYFVTGPMKDVGDQPQTAVIELSAQLPRIISGTRLHAGIIVALLCIGFYYVFLWRMPRGYEVRLVGLNPTASEYAGMNTKHNALLAMFLAGCFAGLAGATEVLGIQLRLFQNFSPNYGFDGIAVALLGNNHPVGIFLSGLLFGMLRSGSNMMQMNARVPNSVVQIIQALIILFVVGREMFNFFKRIERNRALKLRKGDQAQ